MASRRKTMRLTLGKTILAVDSDYDGATKLGADFRAHNVYPRFEATGFEVRMRRGQMARRHFVADDAKRPEIVFVTGIGHGFDNVYTGDQQQPLWAVGQYDAAEAEGKVFHLLSCKTARRLGPDLVDKGALAFFGYDENFVFQQEVADAFFECDSAIDLALAEGATTAQAYERAIELYNQKIDEYDAAGKPYVASLLETDRDHLCAPPVDAIWGDAKTSL